MSDDPNDRRDEEPRRVKVLDKRMFGPDGDLREEYRHLQDQEDQEHRESREKPGEKKTEAAAEEGVSGEARQPSPAAGPSFEAASAPRPAPAGTPPAPDPPTGPGPPVSFYDLVSVLAEPVAIYLGDAKLPDGRSAENLEMARLHIDLMNVLEEKSRGNLSEQEKAVLEDLLYRLRMRYVQKTGERAGS